MLDCSIARWSGAHWPQASNAARAELGEQIDTLQRENDALRAQLEQLQKSPFGPDATDEEKIEAILHEFAVRLRCVAVRRCCGGRCDGRRR